MVRGLTFRLQLDYYANKLGSSQIIKSLKKHMYFFIFLFVSSKKPSIFALALQR